MNKRAYQASKRTFMHNAGLPPPYFDKMIVFFNQDLVGEEMLHE